MPQQTSDDQEMRTKVIALYETFALKKQDGDAKSQEMALAMLRAILHLCKEHGIDDYLHRALVDFACLLSMLGRDAQALDACKQVHRRCVAYLLAAAGDDEKDKIYERQLLNMTQIIFEFDSSSSSVSDKQGIRDCVRLGYGVFQRRRGFGDPRTLVLAFIQASLDYRDGEFQRALRIYEYALGSTIIPRGCIERLVCLCMCADCLIKLSATPTDLEAECVATLLYYASSLVDEFVHEQFVNVFLCVNNGGERIALKIIVSDWDFTNNWFIFNNMLLLASVLVKFDRQEDALVILNRVVLELEADAQAAPHDVRPPALLGLVLKQRVEMFFATGRHVQAAGDLARLARLAAGAAQSRG